MKLITWPEIPITWPLHCASAQAPPHISPPTGSCQAKPLKQWRHHGNCRRVVPGRPVTWSLTGHVTPPPWWITTSVRLTTSDISDLQSKLESPAWAFFSISCRQNLLPVWMTQYAFSCRLDRIASNYIKWFIDDVFKTLVDWNSNSCKTQANMQPDLLVKFSPTLWGPIKLNIRAFIRSKPGKSNKIAEGHKSLTWIASLPLNLGSRCFNCNFPQKLGQSSFYDKRRQIIIGSHLF